MPKAAMFNPPPFNGDIIVENPQITAQSNIFDAEDEEYKQKYE